jgi:hypothetical protein
LADAVASAALSSEVEAVMLSRSLLSRIQSFFSLPGGAQPESMEPVRTGKRAPQVRPMSDRELSRAMREFKPGPAAERHSHKRARRTREK